MARPKKTETEITMQEPAELKIRMTFFEEVLGTASGNPELHDEYIASRNPESPNRAKRITEEVEAIGEGNVVEKQMTIFPKLADGTPFAWDYQIKGMFKECAKMMRYIKGSESSRITNYLQKIDGLIFVKERKIPYQNYKRLGDCQRSLRANTPQGPRVALAHSETVPEGSYIEFTVLTLDPSLLPAVREWLDYGKLHGFGQWRNSGKGRFEWEELR